MSGTPNTFLVVGCGSIGRRHARNLAALGAGRVLAYDVRPGAAAAAEGAQPVASLDEAWALKPSAVFVTTPTAFHLEPALAAAERGCALFIEKPLAHRWEGVERLLREVKDRGLVTLVGCNLRFHPALMKIKELLEKNAVGRVTAARVEVGQYLPDWHPAEDYRRGYSARRELGGGIILDAVHEIDYARWLLGEVEEVSCFSGKLSSLEIDTEDTAAILLRFAGGALGQLHLDYVQRAYSRSCQIIGEEGTLRWEWGSDVRFYSAAEKAWTSFPLPQGWEPNAMYLDELKHFLACLDGKEAPCQDVFEAARVLKVALAARRSSDSREVVRLG